MLKKSSIRRIIIATLALFILIIIYLFPSEDNFNESLSYIVPQELPIFLIDKQEYVARTVILKKNMETEKLIKDIIDALTIDSASSTYIPEGFSPVIPKNTRILDTELNNGLLKINFSKEILNIDASLEEKMIEAIIYSLTELADIKKITILVEGNALTKLPNSQKKLPLILDKSYGINKTYNFDSIKDTSKTTIYYLSKNKDMYYYVPVTLVNNETEKVEVIIRELKTTPIYHTNLISYLASSTNLLNYELLENSIALSFDNHILANLDEKNITEEVKYSIALSLRDSYGVESVKFSVLDEDIETLIMN